MRIREITEDKKRYLDLLLLADEQESMIDRYLDRGTMFVLDDGGVKAECVVTDEGDGILEIKSIATAPDFQGRGYGRALIEFVVERYGGAVRDESRDGRCGEPLHDGQPEAFLRDEYCSERAYNEQPSKGERSSDHACSGQSTQRFSILQVGTGDSPLTVPFYERCGFTRSHRIEDFFLDNYDHPIFEAGVQLVDMIYLRRTL